VAQDTNHFTFKKSKQVPDLKQVFQNNATDSDYNISPSYIENNPKKEHLSSGKHDLNVDTHHNAYEFSSYYPKSDL